jgi:hypothetical protein
MLPQNIIQSVNTADVDSKSNQISKHIITITIYVVIIKRSSITVIHSVIIIVIAIIIIIIKCILP